MFLHIFQDWCLIYNFFWIAYFGQWFFQFSLWVRVLPLSSFWLFNNSVSLLRGTHEEPFILYVDTFSCLASVGLCAPSGWAGLGHVTQLPGKATVKAVLKFYHNLWAPFHVLDLLMLIGPLLFHSLVHPSLSGSQSSTLPILAISFASAPPPAPSFGVVCVALPHGFYLGASSIIFQRKKFCPWFYTSILVGFSPFALPHVPIGIAFLNNKSSLMLKLPVASHYLQDRLPVS